MSDWKPIETAPKDGTIVQLRSDRHLGVQQCMMWNGDRWAELAFTPMGTRETFWDPDDPPTHWRPV